MSYTWIRDLTFTSKSFNRQIYCILQRQHADSTRLVRDALKLLRALAGHDSVKNNILKNGAAKQIDDLINLHKVSHTRTHTLH